MTFLATGLFVDGFAGGGGASTGIAQAIGRDVDIAVNHSPSAIAIHKANHPATEHHCQDIRIVWPTAATRMRPVAGAWFSPDCKEHSKAKGGPVKDRNIRQLPWEILPWLQETRPTVCYVENVEEMQQWGPLDADGHVIRELRGTEFKRWIGAIRRLGYRVAWRELRACDYGAPTSRKRLYIVMRCDRQPIVWPKPTHGRPDSPGVRSGRLLPWRTAAECIDWSIPCPSIFDRKRPLKDATNRRIAAGVMRYVVNAAKPFIVPVTHQGGVRVHDIDEPTRTVTGAHRGELAIVDIAVTGLGDPDEGPIGPGHVCKHGVRWPHPCDDCDQAAPPPGWSPHATLAPFASYGQHGGRNRPIDEPHHTIAASKKDTNGLVGATLVRTGHGEVDRHGKRRGKGHHDLTEPAPTVTSSRDEALVAATMVQTGYGERPGQAPRALDVEKPLGTLVAGGGKHAAVTAFLSSFYGSDRNNGGGDPTAPSKTVRAGGQHHAIVTAHIEQANGGQHNTNLSGRDARRPLSTVTTTGSQQRIVETTLIEEGALPPAMMERAVMVAAFLIKYYGNESGGHGLHAPIDTVTTRDRFAVVTVTIDQATYVIVDIGLRMLKPRELANAQGFPANYILDPVVPKVKRGKLVHEPLTIAEQISAIGNSVCPPVARALVAANQPGVAELRRAA